MLRGVASDLSLGAGTLVIDIGGGSTELVTTGADRLEWAISTEAGSVRLTERFVHGDPPSEDELAACAAHVESLLPPLEVRRAIGVAGTVTTAAAVELGGEGSVHRRRLKRESVERVLEQLASLPLDERERVPGLEPARAPVIVAGLVVLRTILARYGLDRARGERARPARRGSARGRGAAGARGRPGTADGLHLLLGERREEALDVPDCVEPPERRVAGDDPVVAASGPGSDRCAAAHRRRPPRRPGCMPPCRSARRRRTSRRTAPACRARRGSARSGSAPPPRSAGSRPGGRPSSGPRCPDTSSCRSPGSAGARRRGHTLPASERSGRSRGGVRAEGRRDAARGVRRPPRRRGRRARGTTRGSPRAAPRPRVRWARQGRPSRWRARIPSRWRPRARGASSTSATRGRPPSSCNRAPRSPAAPCFAPARAPSRALPRAPADRGGAGPSAGCPRSRSVAARRPPPPARAGRAARSPTAARVRARASRVAARGSTPTASSTPTWRSWAHAAVGRESSRISARRSIARSS